MPQRSAPVCRTSASLRVRSAEPRPLQWLRDDGFSPVELERLHVPAGLDIGSRTHSEIALSIYAQLVSLRIEVVTAEPQDSSDPRGAAGGAVDPVCGMIEPAGGAWERIEHDGRELAFCCPAAAVHSRLLQRGMQSSADDVCVGLVLAAGKLPPPRPAEAASPAGTLLGHTLAVARASALDQVVVVLGVSSEAVRDEVDLSGITVTESPAPEQGCALSIGAGLVALREDWTTRCCCSATSPA